MDDEDFVMIRVGLDFDDTLIDTRRSMVAVYNRYFQRNIDFASVKTERISELYGQSFAEYLEFFERNQEKITTGEPFDFVKETLLRFSEKVEFMVLTGRPLLWMSSVERWVRENDLPVSAIYCASQFTNGKTECAKLNAVSLFVEDGAAHALGLAEAGITVLLLDKPYNRGCQHENLVRVKDWHEVCEKLEKLIG